MSQDAAKSMRNTVWIAFGIALVLVNVIAEVGNFYTGIQVHMFLRIAIILGVTFGAAIFRGSFILVSKMDEEKPLSGHVKDTLGPDGKKAGR